jgi:hypothetical protein
MAKLGAVILVCILVLALDVTAGILGIEAQAASNKVKRLIYGNLFPVSQRAFQFSKCFVNYIFWLHYV